MSEAVAVSPARTPIDIVVRPPGSKSQTIRALVVAALAKGVSRLEHTLDAEDTRFARQALRGLGVDIDDTGDPWIVTGSGGRLRPSAEPLDAGASGLTARSLIPAAALVDGVTTIVGRDRLPQRPMGGLVAALRQLGIDVTAEVGGRLPITVTGRGGLPGGSVSVPSGETTQFATGLLLSAPLAGTPLTVEAAGLEGSAGYVEMTLRLMGEFGAVVHRESGARFRVEPTGYEAADLMIEPDASAAVYPMVAAAVCGGRAVIEGLGSTSLQPDMAIAGFLGSMGCDVTQSAHTTTVEWRGTSLAPLDTDLRSSPDGAVALAVACVFAGGRSRLRGLGSLRHKESDRLAALATEIRRLGAGADIEGDDLIITPGTLHGSRIETYEDHRIAMSFALAGLVLTGVEVANPSVVAKTWPGFWEMIDELATPR
jgi:3-phosphoshikimate 1-carboxyvinyltransferase